MDYKQFGYQALLVGVYFCFGLLVVGIVKLSIIRGGYYESLARGNRVVEKTIPALRGDILDRKGRLLAKSSYRYYRLEDENEIFLSTGDYQGDLFEGRDVRQEVVREYPYRELMGLVTGYIGKVDNNDVKDNICGGVMASGDMIGKMGLELSRNCWLVGNNGKRLVEVDAKGRYVRELGRVDPTKGKEVKLTIDAYWQEKAYQLLEGKKGAVIISRPDTGEIISLVSSPSIDPNVFSYEIDSRQINTYLNDQNGTPLLNRPIAAKYHPGSVFKPVVVAAGIESGVIDKNTRIEDTGFIKIGDYLYRNWLWTKRGVTEGSLDAVEALMRSNDIFFYKLGEKLGPGRIKDWAELFGYGEKTGVQLPGELTGVVPDESWKEKQKGEKWFLGNTYHLSIGQGDLAVTPLQVNLMTNVIANEGKKCKLTMLDVEKENCQGIGLSEESLQIIKLGMEKACKQGGTAWPLFNFKTKIACKTGTAEVGDGSKDTHAWLTAYAPEDNPEVSVTVVVERAGEGSDAAAPIVGDILKEWFGEDDTVVPRYTD